MVLLIDTATLPPHERDDALGAMFSAASGPTRVTHAVAAEQIRNQTRSWNLGSGNGIIRTRDTGLRLSRSPRALRASGRELFAMSFQHRGTSVYLSGEDAAVQKPGELLLTDVARSYEFAFEGAGDNSSFLMSYDDLGLPLPVVLRAAERIRTSPLYALAQADFAGLSDVAAALAPDEEASAGLAAATIALTRALLVSTSPADAAGDDLRHDHLREIADAYLRAHADDAALTAERIAAACGVSPAELRRLVFADGRTVQDRVRQGVSTA